MRLRAVAISFSPIPCRSLGIGIIEMGSVDTLPLVPPGWSFWSWLAHPGVDSGMLDFPHLHAVIYDPW